MVRLWLKCRNQDGPGGKRDLNRWCLFNSLQTAVNELEWHSASHEKTSRRFDDEETYRQACNCHRRITRRLFAEFCCARLAGCKYLRTLWPRSRRRGGGVLQPMLLKHFNARAFLINRCGGSCYYYLNPDGSIAQPMPMRQILSSWNLLYGSVWHFSSITIQANIWATFSIQVNKLQQSLLTKLVTRQIYDRCRWTNSTVRHFLPDVHYRYAGYVAYRDWRNRTEQDAAALLLSDLCSVSQLAHSNMWSLVRHLGACGNRLAVRSDRPVLHSLRIRRISGGTIPFHPEC